jgi:hypothetical protein
MLRPFGKPIVTKQRLDRGGYTMAKECIMRYQRELIKE